MFKRGAVSSKVEKCGQCDNGYTLERTETVGENGRVVYTHGMKKCEACDGTGRK